MVRPLRIEYPGAVYFVSSKADFPVFADDQDRSTLLNLMAQAAQRFDAQVLAYCLGHEHYELLLFTRHANLSRLMRHLNGVYTQAFNRRQSRAGQLFHGRFKAVVVERETQLLDACRYIDMGAARWGEVDAPANWMWSSFRAHAGLDEAPPWLDCEGLWSYVADVHVQSAAERRRAAQRYTRLVHSDPELNILPRIRHQVFLGSDEFIQELRDLGRTQPRAPSSRPWKDWLKEAQGDRERALYNAHTVGGVSMSDLAQELDLSISRVSRLISAYERKQELVT
ncbi:transposase [Roseateles sp. BYS180W]|uniref:Transposase n=1 Tax=Roseateles rivi TaxID=3299028 RepID=A0ABW7FRF8_9BURK